MSLSSDAKKKTQTSDIHLRMSKDTEERVRQHIQQQYGQFKKGLMSKAIERLILKGLDVGCTHTQNTQLNNPYGIPRGRLKAKKLMQDISNYFIQNGIRTELKQGAFIPLSQLRGAVKDLLGYRDVHNRALIKSIKELVDYGYLSDKNGSSVFTVLDTGSDEEELIRIKKMRSKLPREDTNNQQQAEKEKEKEFEEIIGTYLPTQ